jgi:hypothetical protein
MTTTATTMKRKQEQRLPLLHDEKPGGGRRNLSKNCKNARHSQARSMTSLRMKQRRGCAPCSRLAQVNTMRTPRKPLLTRPPLPQRA